MLNLDCGRRSTLDLLGAGHVFVAIEAGCIRVRAILGNCCTAVEELQNRAREHRDANQIPPAEEWAQFIEYGLQGITIPEEYGGNPVDDISESIIIEELARVDPSFSVMFCVHVGLCAKTIALHGNEYQKKER